MRFGFRTLVLATAPLALSACLDVLETSQFRDSGAPVDVSGTEDVPVAEDVQPLDVVHHDGTDVAFDVIRPDVVDVSPIDATDVSRDGMGGDAHASDGMGSDGTTITDVHVEPLDGGPEDAGSTCPSIPFTCPSLTLLTCTTATALMTTTLPSALSAPCCSDTDCVLVTTDRCCGSNSAVRAGSIADCITSIESSIDGLCPRAICPAVVCNVYSAVCSAGRCVAIPGA